jgi:hypothetical protein
VALFLFFLLFARPLFLFPPSTNESHPPSTNGAFVDPPRGNIVQDYATAADEYQACRAQCAARAAKLPDAANDRDFAESSGEYATLVARAWLAQPRVVYETDGANDRDYTVAGANLDRAVDAANDRGYGLAERELAVLRQRQATAAQVDLSNDRSYQTAEAELAHFRRKALEPRRAAQPDDSAHHDGAITRNVQQAAAELASLRSNFYAGSTGTTAVESSSTVPTSMPYTTIPTLSANISPSLTPNPPPDVTDWSNDRAYVITSALRESDKVATTTIST